MSTAPVTAPPNVDAVRDRAHAAAATAQQVRDRVTAGDHTITAADLTTAEADERLAALALTAAEDRATAQAERDTAAQVDADRAAMQQRWTEAHTPDPQLRAHLDTAVTAAVTYLRAAQHRQTDQHDLADQAAALGFAVDVPRNRRDHLPELVAGLVEEIRHVLPWMDPDRPAQPYNPTTPR